MKERVRQLAQRFLQFGLSQSGLSMYDKLYGVGNTGCDGNFFIEQGNTNRQKTILFPYHHNVEHTYKYATLASAFKKRGHRPIFIISDIMEPIVKVESVTSPKSKWEQTTQAYRARSIVEQFGFETTYLSDFVKSNEIKTHKDSVEEQFDVDKIARASVRKATKKYSISDEDSELVSRFRNSAVFVYEVFTEIFSSVDADVVISHDDSYVMGGVPLIAANDNNIHTYVCGVGRRNNTVVVFKIDQEKPLAHFQDKNIVRKVVEKSLIHSQEQKIEEFMQDRMNLNSDSRIQYSAAGKDPVPVTEGVPTIGMFTNLIWDGSLEVEDCPFPDVLDWIETTIELFDSGADSELLIKTHPGESIRGTSQPVYEWIMNNLEGELENVTVLPSDTDVSTYDMLSEIDAGIVYNSTVGLELAYLETPVITAGDTHYRNIGITYDPDTQAEYTDLVERAHTLSVKQRQLLKTKRYLHFLFFGQHLRLPFEINFLNSGGVDHETLSRQIAKINLQSDNNDLDRVVHHCVNGNPVFRAEFDWIYSSDGHNNEPHSEFTTN